MSYIITGSIPARKTIALDLDGTLHDYKSVAWEGLYSLKGKPINGAVEWCNEAIKVANLFVFSSRAVNKIAITSIERWLADNGFPEMEVTNKKEIADVYIDDKGYHFTGKWPDIKALLEKY